MSLTESELEQLATLENRILTLGALLKGASSKNQLNRLYVLNQDIIKKLEEKTTELEAKLKSLITLAQRLQ